MQSRLPRSVFIPFKRGKIPTLSESYPLILYHCRMFLLILKFLQNCTQCMSLRGWFRATCFLLPPRSPRGQHAAFVASLDKYGVLPQKCPWWQIIHYSWLNEINTLCQSLSNTMTLRGKETPNPLCKPPYKQHQGISWFSHLAWSSLPDFAGSKPFLWEGPNYFVWECAF